MILLIQAGVQYIWMILEINKLFLKFFLMFICFSKCKKSLNMI